MIDNKNTSEYWDDRFGSGDWNEHGGQGQTTKYARTLVAQWSITPDFTGKILDFGCALGDAIPVYKTALPAAQLMGLDHSLDAITKCRQNYGELAEFQQGDHDDVPEVDVIVASHVMEHITDDVEIVKVLLTKCKDLYIVVPYREDPLYHEHVRTYDETRYAELGQYEWRVFDKAPYQLTWHLMYHMHLKNILRPLVGKKIVKPARAIMYHFGSHG